MKGLKDFRRSLNKERQSGGKPGTSTPAMFMGVKSAVSIQPPKMVIKAVREYRARAPQELSFQKGDFFHVLSDSANPDWFEAANPMTNARGLVPASYFEVLTKSSRPGASGAAGPSMVPAVPAAARSAGLAQYGRAAGAAMPGKVGGGFYAVVRYDFEAERTDELAAKAGESIIVIAQSNYEWFVAKPIERLGGPGLIPVAFVEIRDLTTQQPIEDVNELISSGVIPKVEDWKKMTAEYKSTAIPLGRFDFPQSQPVADSPYQQPGSMQGSRDFGGEGEAPAPPPKRGSSAPGDAGEEEELPPGLPPGEPLPTGIITTATVDSFHFEQGDYWFRIQAAHIAQLNSNAPPTAPTAPEGEERDLILYRLYEDFYEFQIALLDHFPAEAGRETDAKGQPTQRILPLMPGPLEEVDDVVTAQRRNDLDLYINQLCGLPEYIMRSELIRLFFEPRPGDHCTVIPAPGSVPAPSSDHELGQEAAQAMRAAAMLESNGTSKYAEDAPVGPRSADGAHGTQESLNSRTESLRLEDRDRASEQSGSDGRSSGLTGPSGSSYLQPQYSMTRNHSATTVGSRGSGGSSNHAGWANASRKDSIPGGAGASAGAGGTAAAAAGASANASNTGTNAGFIKIKIFHRATDDLVAIRVPPSVTYAALLEKVRDRLGNDINVLRYREQMDAGGSAMMRLSDDDDLKDWLGSGAQKLTLYADSK